MRSNASRMRTQVNHIVQIEDQGRDTFFVVAGTMTKRKVESCKDEALSPSEIHEASRKKQP